MARSAETNAAVMLGGGDGTFATAVPYAFGDITVDGFATADFDGDLHADIIVSTGTVLFGAGDGTFSTVHYPVTPRVAAQAVGDINADGVPDILSTGNVSEQVRAALGVAGGAGFAAPVSIAIGVPGTGVRHLVTGDLNGDGGADVALATSNTDGVSVLRTIASSGFGSGSLARPYGYLSEQPANAVVADLDGDGVADVASVGDQLRTLLSAGLGGVGSGAPAAATSRMAGNSPTAIAAADLDADGTIDLVIASSFTPRVMVFAVRGDGGLNRTEFHDLGAGGKQVVISDLDGDTTNDLIVATADGFEVLLGNEAAGVANGTFGAPNAVNIPPSPSGKGLVVGDFNADGDLDVVTCKSTATDALDFHAGDGAGGFAASVPIALGGPCEALVSGDFDADGTLDLAALLSSPPEVGILIGNETLARPDGTFVTPATTIPVAGFVWGIGARDLDGDGILDLVVTSHSSGVFEFQVLAGRGVAGVGDGTFSGAVSFSTLDARHPSRFDIADVNGDAVPDLVIAGSASDQLTIVPGQWESTLGSWSAPLRAFVASGSGAMWHGPSFFQTGTDRSMSAFAQEYVSQHIAMVIGRHEDFIRGLHHTGSTLPAPLIPLTHAWQVHGDVRLARVEEPSFAGVAATGDRLRVENRFGPRLDATPGSTDFDRAGLDLTGAFAAQRGLVIELPFLASRGPANVMPPATVHVYRRTVDWMRANTVAADPMSGSPGADRYLPRVKYGTNPDYQDAIREVVTWEPVSRAMNDNLSLGSGPRFAVVTSGGPNRVRVLTDRGGIYQAFYKP